jgi:hypothetical protein
MPNFRSNLGEDTTLKSATFADGAHGSGYGSIGVLGTVKMQVVLFEAGRCPFSKRVRQVHEFLFTKNNLQFLNASKKDDVEAIDVGSSVGITLKRAQYGRLPTCFAEKVFVSRSGASLFDTATSEVVSNSPLEFTSNSNQTSLGIDVEGIDEIADSVRSENESFFIHQLFRHVPGLFTDLIDRDKIKGLVNSSGQQRENAKSPLEDLVPVSRTRNISEPKKKGQKRMPGQEVTVSADQQFGSELPYVQLTTSFVGNLFEKLGEEISDSQLFNSGRAQTIGEPIGTTVPRKNSYKNLNPGMHVSYEKVTDLFAGLDFSFRFHNTTGQFPKVNLDKVNSQAPGDGRKVATAAFLMRDDYCYLDPLYIDSDDTDGNIVYSASSSPSVVPDNTISDAARVEKNFGVARPVYRTAMENGESTTPSFVIPSDAEKNYLAEQPYIIIEVDGGEENRFFICITNESDVSVYEVTRDPEWVSALTGNSAQQTTVLRGDRNHSRLLATMKKSGASILKMDAFEISVQHYFGRLQISIDGSEPLVIERNRWPESIREMARKQMLTESQLQALDSENKSGNNQYFSPIKLSGKIRVHMGNYRGAFNFSPLQYVPSVSVTTQFPVTVLDIAIPPREKPSAQSSSVALLNPQYDKQALSILLRAKGSRDATKNAEDIENGTAVGFSGEEPAYWFQSCLEIEEIIGGNSQKFSSDKFSLDVRKTISGDTYGAASSDASSYAGFKVDRPSVIKASYKDSANPNNPSSINITPSITLNAGSLALLGGSEPYILENCFRPLCTSFTVFIKEDESDRWISEPVDITNHVIDFQENWTRNERYRINHQGTMKLYLTKGEAQGNFETIKPVSVTGEQYPVDSSVGGQDTNSSQADKSDYLASLQDRYFYITVYAWREGAGYFDGSMYTTLASGAGKKSRRAMFTGICNDVSFQTEATKIIMTCNLRDYFMVLEHMRWLNAPYYDAMRDYNAVLDVICQAGFKLGGGNSSSENGNDSASGGSRAGSSASLTDPGRLIKELASIKPQSDYLVVQFGDEQIIWNDNVLPGKYATLNSPMFKPKVSDAYIGILETWAKMMGKTMFFDANGVFHFDIPVDEAEMQQIDRSTQQTQGFPQLKPVDYFSWSPRDSRLRLGASGGSGSPAQASAETPSDISGASGESTANANSPIAGSNYKWWNVVSGGSYSFKRMTKDVVNEIRLISSTPNMSKMIAGHLNKSSIVDPASPSFIGYKKMFFQAQAVFGSKDTLEGQLSRYSKMFNAPVEITFTVPGRTGLRPMQIIEFNGFGSAGPTKLLIGEIKNDIVAADNKWETTVTGLYFIPGETVKLNGSALWTVNTDGSVSNSTGNQVGGTTT